MQREDNSIFIWIDLFWIEKKTRREEIYQLLQLQDIEHLVKTANTSSCCQKWLK